jgi:MFS family permease
MGVALVVPSVFTAAGAATDRAKSANAGAAIATVGALGWLGFVCGPPVVGHLAELVGLTPTLWLLPAMTLAIAVIVRRHTAFRRRLPERQAARQAPAEHTAAPEAAIRPRS